MSTIAGSVDTVPAASEESAPASAPVAGGRLGQVLGRYEVVLATVAAMVLIVRVAGGGFLNDRPEPVEPAAAATPFTSAAEPSAPPIPDPPPAASTVPVASPLLPAADVAAPGALPGSPPSPASPVLATVPAPGGAAGIAVLEDGSFWVSSATAADGATLFRFRADGSFERRVTVPDITGGFHALAVGPDGDLWALSRSPAAVVRMAADDGTGAVVAPIPDVRPCLGPIVTSDCDGSLVDAAPEPAGLAFGENGELFVSDAAQGAIWRLEAGDDAVTQWLVEPSWTNPARAAGPRGIAVDGAGNLVVAVRSQLVEDVGVVAVVERTEDGAAGEMRELARTGEGSAPSGLALSAAGNTFVALAGSGQVAVLGPDGTELRRLPDEGTVASPSGVAFRGSSLLVVSAPDEGPAQVFRFDAGEPGAPLRRR